jgi:hypothetical protein
MAILIAMTKENQRLGDNRNVLGTYSLNDLGLVDRKHNDAFKVFLAAGLVRGSSSYLLFLFSMLQNSV